ncbi:LAMI_0H05358g1_1 [Lachancea mirantina]|uniref:LAMI_0H05358g1_1 n=1 Tax=Lachancea mirantina TaxID=1230905 RepID=A0A1G4KEV9_9SACH|nr:LAMI_0H05358g1_1 [Lachancea mirantina]
MLCRSLVAVLVVFLRVSAAITSYTSFGTSKYREAVSNGQATSLAQLAVISDAQEPLIVFQFLKFDLLGAIEQQKSQAGFLTELLHNTANFEILAQDELLKVPPAGGKQFVVAEIPAAPSELLYGNFQKSDNCIVFQFTNTDYDLARLDEFAEIAFVFLEEELSSADNFVFQLGAEKSFKAQARNQAESEAIGVSDPEGDSKPVLSSLWTDGLITCLLVTGLLIWILVIAISWITSLEISYGAFQKPSDPIKKTN